MSIHKEIKFEDEVCEHLADHGYCTAVLINTDRSLPGTVQSDAEVKTRAGCEGGGGWMFTTGVRQTGTV